MAAARQGTPQRGSGGWPPDIKPCLCVTMKSVLNAKPPLTASASLGTRFARLGRFPMGRAHPQGAVTRLCVKHLYTFYMFYTLKPFVYLVYFVVQIFAPFADKNFTCFKRQHLYCDTTWLLDTPTALCTPQSARGSPGVSDPTTPPQNLRFVQRHMLPQAFARGRYQILLARRWPRKDK